MASFSLKYLRSHLSGITLSGLILYIVFFTMKMERWNTRIIDYDVVHYYGYLPATFIYHDPGARFTDQDPKYFGNKIWYNTTPGGNRVYKVSMGMSICYLPFFLGAHAFALVTGSEYSGFSKPYKVALIISCLVFVITGLYYLRKLLRLWFSEITVSLVLILLVLATNLFNYITYDSPMSHAYSFSIITCFLWHTVQWHRRPAAWRAFVIGLLLGWIFLIRPVNVMAAGIFAGWGVYGPGSAGDKARLLLSRWKDILLLATGALIFCIPQLIYWKYYSGSWMFYSYVGEHFFFSHPKIPEGLFSWRKGWLLYTPVMILAFAGLFFTRKVAEVRLVYPVSLALILYVTFSWWCWWYGGGMGQRPLIDWYGWMAIPVACVVEASRKHRAALGAVTAFIIFCCWLNLLQHAQYRNSSLHNDSMTREAYFYRFGSVNKHPGVGRFLHSPDYEKARAGEREYFWE